MLKHHAERWNELAESDPLWAILSNPSAKGNRWKLNDFFATGDRELAPIFSRAAELERPETFGVALDFGCGVGRLTRAMSARFQRSVGVDISPSMIRQARELNSDRPGCDFLVNSTPDLRQFPDGYFDFVYTSNVLQHLVHQESILGYVREFVRVLAARGLAVFQLPTHIALTKSLHWRPNLYELGRTLGVKADHLLRIGLHPIRMVAVPEGQVIQAIKRAGGDVRCALSSPVEQVISTVFYVSK